MWTLLQGQTAHDTLPMTQRGGLTWPPSEGRHYTHDPPRQLYQRGYSSDNASVDDGEGQRRGPLRQVCLVRQSTHCEQLTIGNISTTHTNETTTAPTHAVQGSVDTTQAS